MKKIISSLILTSFLVFTGCSSENTDTTQNNSSELYKVGMITDIGGIDDKSFNQGTWQGITQYEQENKTIETKYIQPSGEEMEDYLISIDSLSTNNYEMIITPGFKFDETIYEAQVQYPEQKFVIIDGYPHNGDFVEDVKENTTAILFAEQEAGFYAGITAALTTKTNKVSFIGGMEVDAVDKFGKGFVMGVAYASSVYGTKAKVTDYVYQGTFTEVAAGQALAGGFYENGADIVFSVAGAVGIGAINEAKARKSNGEEVWAIGVDIDQYEEGKLPDGSSVILTSAIKGIDKASYDMIDSAINNSWTGGEIIVYDSSKNGVGLPSENPNMSEEAIKAYEETFIKVANKEIIIPQETEEVNEFLKTYNYENVISFE